MDKTSAALGMVIVAVVAGVGNLLASPEKITARLVLGRAMTSGALGLSASLLLIWYPDIDPITLAGVAGLLGSLGTSGIERLAQNWIKR